MKLYYYWILFKIYLKRSKKMIKNFLIGFVIGFIAVAWASATITNSHQIMQSYVESENV